MTIAYRVGQLAPWNAGDGPNWERKPFGDLDRATTHLKSLIDPKRDQGKGFKARIRSHDWSDVITKDKLDEALEVRVKNSQLGEYVVALSLKSGFRWFIRKVEIDPIAKTVGNNWIDKIFDFVFEEAADLHPENWGICVRRSINGLSIPTQHCPFEDMNDAGGPGSNAIDIGGLTGPQADQMAERMIRSEECPVGKILSQGKAWEDGHWRTVPGIGHFDHIHAQGLHERPSTWSIVRSSCP